ncbi:MAG: hypothetical protein AAFO07_02015 [Bacteroidota bacterium]
MQALTFLDFLNFVGAILVSVGGATGLIIAISKWYGGVLAEKLLNKDKAKYQEKLEDLKNKYQTELERTKTELEKSKSLFLRYAEHQFTLYNDLWKSLIDLKFIANELWEKLDSNKLKAFSKQLRETTEIVEKSLLLIESEHYQELNELIQEFENFRFGKARLGELRNKKINEFQEEGINEYSIKDTINSNGETRERFTNLLVRIGDDFRAQIGGSYK